MKNKLLVISIFILVTHVHAQRFSHALGVNYDRYISTYTQADVMSVMYRPSFKLYHKNNRFNYLLSIPFAFGKKKGTDGGKSSILIELPAALELIWRPHGNTCNPHRNYFIRVGAGVSRFLSNEGNVIGTTSFNACFGFGKARLGPLEMRLVYGSNLYLLGRNNRLGVGLCYMLR